MNAPLLARAPRRNAPRLAVLFPDGSLTILAAGAHEAEAFMLCDDDGCSIVRVTVDVVTNIGVPLALEDVPYG